METQHLTYFKVENFKRFDSFEMSNLGQFNLLVGDNNVGKTSVLEALLFDGDLDKLMRQTWGAFCWRKMFDLSDENSRTISPTQFWQYIFKDQSRSINVDIKSFDANFQMQLDLIKSDDLTLFEKEKVQIELTDGIPKFWLKQTIIPALVKIKGAYFESASNPDLDSYYPYVPSSLTNAEDLTNFYYQHINTNKETRKELEENLRKFIPDLEEIRTHRFMPNQETLSLTLTNGNGIYPISRYGEGTVKLTRLLLEILMARGKRLMIDEIGAGIHFSRLYDYWKTILQLCRKYEVQLFATTHSLECQQAFIEVLEDPNMLDYQSEARNVTLLEDKNGDVKSVTYDFEQFKFALNIGFNTRGGK